MTPDAGAGAATTRSRASPSSSGKPDRRAILLRVFLLAAILGFVFGLVLPRVVDYDAVLAALADLSPAQLAILATVTIVAYVANAAPCRVLVPGLSWPRAVGADLAARAVASTIPGPTDVATRFALYRQWAIPADTASAGILFAAFFETLSSLVLPLIATIGVIAVGRTTDPEVLWLTLIGLAVLAVAVLVLMAIVRSEALALRAGRWLDGLARRIWTLFRRRPPTGIVESVQEIRRQSRDTLSGHGVIGFAAAVAAKLTWFVVLEVSLWAVGLDWAVLPPEAVLTAMAVVAIVALIPITPGAVGITEGAYIGVLSAVAGPGATAQVTAAVMVFRIVQWLAPIPIGWALLIGMRRRPLAQLLSDDAETTQPPRPATAR